MDFRALNYLGSKLRILEFIENNISALKSKTTGVCDLLAGTGCVSYRLSQKYPIVSCDKQKYSEIICNALVCKPSISNHEIAVFIRNLNGETYRKLISIYSPLIKFEEDSINDKNVQSISEIIENGSIEVSRLKGGNSDSYLSSLISNIDSSTVHELDNVITEYYGGVYFSYKQAIQIDTIIQCIESSYPNNPHLIAALLSTTSDIVNTVGKHFAQPLKTTDSSGRVKPMLYKTAQKDRSIDVFERYSYWINKYINLSRSSLDYSFMNTDFLQCLNELPDKINVIYADPPYTREHYSRYYHVLETIVLRDRPTISKTKINGIEQFSRGIYREERFQSDFCIRSKAPKVFDTMFDVAASHGKSLLLSYSPYDETKQTHPRVVTMKQLTDLAGKHFRNIDTSSAGHFTHNKLNSKEHNLEASDNAEVLIICTNV